MGLVGDEGGMSQQVTTTMQTDKFSTDEELYIASCNNTQKVAKETRFYTTQLGQKEGRTQKQAILACSAIEKEKMVKCANVDMHTTITHKRVAKETRFYTPRLGQRDRNTQEQVLRAILACSVLEKQTVVQCANADEHTIITHKRVSKET